MQTAVMRGLREPAPFFLPSINTVLGVAQHCRYAPPDTLGSGPLFRHSARHVGPTVEAAPPREARGGFSRGLAAPGDLATFRMMIGFYEKMTV